MCRRNVQVDPLSVIAATEAAVFAALAIARRESFDDEAAETFRTELFGAASADVTIIFPADVLEAAVEALAEVVMASNPDDGEFAADLFAAATLRLKAAFDAQRARALHGDPLLRITDIEARDATTIRRAHGW